ncbi:MAG: hypothetical protein ABI790_04410 [Betaproteobacteria bacterium]
MGVAPMGWVFFQVFLAFGIAVFIVWWTFPRKEKEAEKEKEKPAEPPTKDPQP